VSKKSSQLILKFFKGLKRRSSNASSACQNSKDKDVGETKMASILPNNLEQFSCFSYLREDQKINTT